jgi:iron uptake system component EfeO
MLIRSFRLICRPMVRRLLASLALGVIVASLAGCGGESGASAETAQRLQTSLAQYETYLQENSEKLLHWANTIVLKVEEGSNPKAASRYAAARVPYGHLAPTARLFEPLNKRIDGLEDEVPPDEFGGFHQIEKAIFWEKTSSDMGPVARQLRKDIEELQRRIDAADLQPSQILTGANQTLEGVIEHEIWGVAELYSHIDLTDIAAKVEGIEAAYNAAEPEVAESDPALAKDIENQLEEVYARVGKYGILARDPEQARDREPGISFVVYDQLTQEERWELAQPLKVWASLLARAEAELAGS